jgi:hypothetical protein
VERGDDVVKALHRLVVNSQEHIAATNVRLRGGRILRDLGSNDALSPDAPEHTVLDLVERGPSHDVRGAQRQQDTDNDDREDRVSPANPRALHTRQA